jgi:hypothetical protein
MYWPRKLARAEFLRMDHVEADPVGGRIGLHETDDHRHARFPGGGGELAGHGGGRRWRLFNEDRQAARDRRETDFVMPLRPHREPHSIDVAAF